MKRWIAAVCFVFATPAAAQDYAVRYMWAQDGDSAVGERVEADPRYAFPSGVAYERYGRARDGNYSIDVGPGGREELRNSGALVTAYGSDAICTTDLPSSVRCFGPATAEPDGALIGLTTQFSYLMVSAPSSEAANVAHVFVDPHGGVSPAAFLGTDRADTPMQVLSRGRYRVAVGAAAGEESVVLVTTAFDAVGDCNPVSWGFNSVVVGCYATNSATPTDHRFRIVAISGRGGDIDYLMQGSRTATPRVVASRSGNGGEIAQNVVRRDVGYYDVTLGASADPGGHVQIDAYGGPGRCSIDSWGNKHVYVRCTQNGVPADTPFVVLGIPPRTARMHGPDLSYDPDDRPDIELPPPPRPTRPTDD